MTNALCSRPLRRGKDLKFIMPGAGSLRAEKSHRAAQEEQGCSFWFSKTSRSLSWPVSTSRAPVVGFRGLYLLVNHPIPGFPSLLSVAARVVVTEAVRASRSRLRSNLFATWLERHHLCDSENWTIRKKKKEWKEVSISTHLFQPHQSPLLISPSFGLNRNSFLTRRPLRCFLNQGEKQTRPQVAKHVEVLLAG